MGAIAAKMRAFVRARIQYYQDDRQAIAAANMLNLRVATGLTFAFLLGFLALSPWLLPGWTPSVWHIGFVPVSAGLCVLSLTLGKRGQAQPPVATALCVLYEATLYLGMVLIDAPGSPDAPATFLPLVIIAMPALFTLPLRCTYGLILLAAAGYVAAALICKKPMVARYDIFELAAAIFFSLAVSYMSDDLRMRAYKMRQIYQRQSTRDALLDVYNKKAFEENARRYIDAFNPHAACALAVVDLDDFKQVNDTCGHLFGDTVLQKLGTAMQAQMRPGDLVGRFGGDGRVPPVCGGGGHRGGGAAPLRAAVRRAGRDGPAGQPAPDLQHGHRCGPRPAGGLRQPLRPGGRRPLSGQDRGQEHLPLRRLPGVTGRTLTIQQERPCAVAQNGTGSFCGYRGIRRRPSPPASSSAGRWAGGSAPWCRGRGR